MLFKKKPIRIAVASVIACVALLFWPVDLQRAQLSPSLLASDGSLLRAYPAPDGQMRLPITIEKIDPVFIDMLLAYEDRRFNYHPGVDLFALLRAAYQWGKTGGVVSGGSTLTMQVARLLSPASRTLPHKIMEIWRAMRLETQYSKRDILNLYFRLAPYGGNLAGIRAATLVYFNKEPLHLTPDEAALLVALPQNPNGFRPDRFPPQARAARRKILHHLQRNGTISATAMAAGLAADIPSKRFELPKSAPHLADYLRATQKDQAPWHSTLDGKLQKKLEHILYERLSFVAPQATIAALVVDNKTRSVRAYIGNADYFSTTRAGQIDMVKAMRSPGSTLKPFAYGMAFQDGLAVPETIIRDAQVRFGTYTPSNFNQGFTGDVTMRQALQQSLNIPAVKILNEIGAQRFLAKLNASSGVFKLPERKDTAELPIILGGLGTNLWDITQLYVGLANAGHVQPLHVLQQANKTTIDYPILTKKAAAQITDILTGSALNEGVMRGPELADLAVKTGTSYGYRDAWSIGYTPDYTIGVWIGRADGTPSPGQIGRNTAIPVLLAIRDAMGPASKNWPVLAEDAFIPERLKRWIGDRTRGNENKSTAALLTIHYPIDNSVFAWHDVAVRGIKLLAQGGSKPYQWYANGAAVPLTDNKNFIWRPAGPGFYKLTVQDKNNHTITESIQISHE